MPRVVSSCSTVLLLVLLAAPTGATPVVVPGNYPTIQTAIDAGEQEIQVRDGVAPERLRVNHSVTIEPVPVNGNGWGLGWESMPSIVSIEMSQPCEEATIRVRGARFLGSVRLSMCNGYLAFDRCRFDSGFVAPNHYAPEQRASVRGCMIIGGCTVNSAYTQFIGNTVIGGTASVTSDGLHDVRNNYCVGPASAGLDLSLRDSDGPVTGNIVRGTTDGIRVPGHPYGPIRFNDVANCSGDGIVLADEIDAPCDSNLVSNCAGNGITVRARNQYNPMVRLRGNLIRNSGKDGVHLENAAAAPFTNNVILDSGGDGVVVITDQGRFPNFVDGVTGNIIGRNRGAGIRIHGLPTQMSGNTIFANGGSGIEAQDGSFGQLNHNLFAFNGGPGVVNTGGHAPTSECNDWFANGGEPVGLSYGANEWFVDPLFCDRFTGDGHLTSNSPLLSAADCGLIGALGVGCDAATTDVHPEPSPPIHFAALPMPASGVVRFAIPLGIGPSELEVFDITGARRWSATVDAGARPLQWNRRQIDGSVAAPGVYFARLRQGDREIARTRIILTR